MHSYFNIIKRSITLKCPTNLPRFSVITDQITKVIIIHQTTAPYTPQQNGVAERKNRTLKEMVNFMLSYSGLSEGFWGEAMLIACYLLNRIPNKRNKVTPYERDQLH